MKRLAVVALLLAGPAWGQERIGLGELQAAAVARDPRVEQLELARASLELRLANLRAERLPQVGVEAEAAHQSDVMRLPGVGGGIVPEPPKSRFQAGLSAEQRVYDGGANASRRAVEEARLAERVAAIEAELYPLRMEVTEAYFAALLAQSRREQMAAMAERLGARLAEVRALYVEGAALPGDTAAVEVERLRALQGLAEADAGYATALGVLTELTGVRLASEAMLEVPALEAEMEAALAAGGAGALRARPEFDRIERTVERLEREAAAVGAAARPQVRAFGVAGLGRPGPFEVLESDINRFWRVGVRLQWQPSVWGSRSRESELIRLEQEVARTEADALAERLARETEDELRTIDQLRSNLEADERIVLLLETIEAQAAAQLAERAATPADYVDRLTALVEGRLSRDRHRIELERARARYLTTVGRRLDEEADR